MQYNTINKHLPEMNASTTDNSCTRISPCKGMPREGKDKSVCAPFCERLKAYRDNQPYQHLKCVDILS